LTTPPPLPGQTQSTSPTPSGPSQRWRPSTRLTVLLGVVVLLILGGSLFAIQLSPQAQLERSPLRMDRLRQPPRHMLVPQPLPDKRSIDRPRLALPSSAIH
jgi:hypothetical protein